MNILDIYKKYYLPENLQMHMLRVAACSNLIIDNWNGPKINEEKIIRVCILHDMGNIVKIPEGYSKDVNFNNLRKKCLEKYGFNDKAINIEIGKREGLTEEELQLLSGIDSSVVEETLKLDYYERKICHYCDQRVAPNGITSVKERLEDVKVRYKNKPLSDWSNEEKANHMIECSLKIEKQIMKYCKIKPENINNKSAEEYIQRLKKYEI